MKTTTSMMFGVLFTLTVALTSFNSYAGDDEWGTAGKVLTGFKLIELVTGRDPITEVFGKKTENKQPADEKVVVVRDNRSHYPTNNDTEYRRYLNLSEAIVKEVTEDVKEKETKVLDDGTIIFYEVVVRKTVIKKADNIVIQK